MKGINARRTASPISDSASSTISSSRLADMTIDREGATSSQSSKKSTRQVATLRLYAGSLGAPPTILAETSIGDHFSRYVKICVESATIS